MIGWVIRPWIAGLLLLGTNPAAATNPWDAGELIFQSGFEGSTALAPYPKGNHRLVGADPALKLSDWEADIARFAGTTPAIVNYTGGVESQRLATIASDPTNKANHTLRYWLKEAYAATENETKARVQVDLYGINPGLREFRQSVRVFIGREFLALERFPGPIRWLTLAEYWNNEWWVAGEPYGFRITVGIGKPVAREQALNIFVEAEDKGQIRIWEHNDPSAKVPIGKWFTLESYYREGDSRTGRFALAITPDGGKRRVIYDVTGFTHNSHDPAPNGVSGYNPMKLYTSRQVMDFTRENGKPLTIHWDDLAIWRIR